MGQTPHLGLAWDKAEMPPPRENPGICGESLNGWSVQDPVRAMRETYMRGPSFFVHFDKHTPHLVVQPIAQTYRVYVRTTSAEGSSGEGLLRDAQNTSQARARE